MTFTIAIVIAFYYYYYYFISTKLGCELRKHSRRSPVCLLLPQELQMLDFGFGEERVYLKTQKLLLLWDLDVPDN